MSGFSHLYVDGFRRLLNVDLELRPLAVLIGANGSGKTSLLEVLSLLSASAQGKLAEIISELSGLAAIMTSGRKRSLGFALEMEVPQKQPLQYILTIEATGVGYGIRSETLTRSGGTLLEPGNLKAETALSQATKTSPRALEFRDKLASSALYHTLDVGPKSRVRLPQPIKPAELPGEDGENLVASLYHLRESYPDRFEAIRDTLSAAFPAFEGLTFPPVAAGTLAMIWRDRNFREGFYTHQLSEGMLRFLWLATLLNSPALPQLTLIDEPEVSLHPELLSLLADLLREASQRSQIVVATHSDMLVRFLKPEEVVVCDITDDGRATLTWADKLDLEKWLDEYTLDEVWRMGRLGGRA